MQYTWKARDSCFLSKQIGILVYICRQIRLKFNIERDDSPPVKLDSLYTLVVPFTRSSTPNTQHGADDVKIRTVFYTNLRNIIELIRNNK